jgi:hypothetical protein
LAQRIRIITVEPAGPGYLPDKPVPEMTAAESTGAIIVTKDREIRKPEQAEGSRFCGLLHSAARADGAAYPAGVVCIKKPSPKGSG